MSFDPFNQQQPPREPEAFQPTPSQSAHGPLVPASPPPSVNLARERILFPAVLLLVSGILNLLFAGYFVLNMVVYMNIDPETKKEQNKTQMEMIAKMFPGFAKAMEDRRKEGHDVDAEMAQQQESAMTYGSIFTGVSILAALLTILGGVRLLQLRNYGLVVFASILTAIPCVSGSACCCIGEVAGLWAIIMLLQTDVRDAFR